MSADLQGAISSAISQANDKAAQKSEGNFSEDLARERVASANSRISVAENKVTKYQGEMAKVDQQLANPPMIDKQTGDGKSSSTTQVADANEVRRLETKKGDIDKMLAQAQQEVKSAQEEAQTASAEAIDQAGINEGTQNEMDSLLAKANNIRNTLSEGGTVEESEIKDLTDRFSKVADELTEEQNPGGLLSEAFYEPMADTLKDISELLENPPVNDAEIDPENLPPLNKELYDVGITDIGQQSEFIDMNEELNAFADGIRENGGQFNEEYSEAKFSEMVAKNTTLREPLNDTQKNTGVIKTNNDIIEGIKESTGFTG